MSISKTTSVLGLALLAQLILGSTSTAVENPVLNTTINDFAGMMPQASYHDLEERLTRFKTQTGHTVVILTLPSLEQEDLATFGRKAFKSLPLDERSLQKSILLVVARKEQKVDVQVGAELRSLFPMPAAGEKLQAHVDLYFNGLRPDLGIHGAIHYIFKVIRGDFRVDRSTEEEKLEGRSISGAGGGAILAVFLGPFLAFFVGGFWGVYATHYGVQRETRLFVGAVLGGGTAKLVATFMAMIGSFSDGLWYFIMAVSIPLAAFASLTEYWMQGDWSGIPKEKGGGLRRKPSDKMGI
jgi:uncharacterized membrane protein YgcG